MADDFEMVESSRRKTAKKELERVQGEVVDLPDKKKTLSGKDKLMGAVADNFPRILDVAAEIVELEKMDLQAGYYIEELKEKRKTLKAETEAYVKKLEAEVDANVQYAEVIRRMVQDYNRSGDRRMSEEVFSEIVQKVIKELWEKGDR